MYYPAKLISCVSIYTKQILRNLGKLIDHPARIRGAYREMNWLRISMGKLEGVQ